MSEPQVVTVRGLRKSYGTRMVVDGLDLDVPAGEIVGLIGANGAGKTTTVECIQGLRKPDDGRLRVLGFDPVTQAGQLRPLVGSQLQSSALPDRLRVAEALELFSTQRARDGQARPADRASQRFEALVDASLGIRPIRNLRDREQQLRQQWMAWDRDGVLYLFLESHGGAGVAVTMGRDGANPVQARRGHGSREMGGSRAGEPGQLR